MKLLFEQNLSPSLVRRLEDIYPESNHVYPLGLDQVSDEIVWDYARESDFLIVTKDVDFSELCSVRGFPLKIIWIRRGNCKTADIEAILRKHYSDVDALNRNESSGVLTLL